jgi:hypothetical protein
MILQAFSGKRLILSERSKTPRRKTIRDAMLRQKMFPKTNILPPWLGV